MAENVKATEKTTVKMKFVGIMKGNIRTVELPIPLVSNSQKLDGQLTFARQPGSHGPLTCDVPMKWAGSLLALGGNWKINEDLTDELKAKIEAAKASCAKEMEAFVLENEMVDA